MPLFTRRRGLAASALAFVLLAALLGPGIVFALSPTLAFRQLTDRPLPPGVRVTDYASEMNDNLFRSTHYWRLEHGPDGFRSLQAGADFRRYSDDVAGYIAAVRQKLAPDLRDQDISEIREWSRPGRRTQLILQRRDASASYYVLSTI